MSIKKIGVPETIGELRDMIKNYPDETIFGFRNQPLQELVEDETEVGMFIEFNEI